MYKVFSQNADTRLYKNIYSFQMKKISIWLNGRSYFLNKAQLSGHFKCITNISENQ